MRKSISMVLVFIMMIMAVPVSYAGNVKISGLSQIGSFPDDIEELEIRVSGAGEGIFIREDVMDREDIEYLLHIFSDESLICIDSDITEYISPVEAVPGSINFSFAGIMEGEYTFYITEEKVFVAFANGNEMTLKQGFFEFKDSGTYDKLMEFIDEKSTAQEQSEVESELEDMKNSVDISEFETIYKAEFPLRQHSEIFEIGVCSYLKSGEKKKTVSAYYKYFHTDNIYIIILSDVNKNTLIQGRERMVKINPEMNIEKEYDYTLGTVEMKHHEFQINVGDDMKAESISVTCSFPDGSIAVEAFVDMNECVQTGKLPSDIFSAEDNIIHVSEEDIEPKPETEKEEETPEGIYYDKGILDSLTADGEAEIQFTSKKYDINHGFGFSSGKLTKQKAAVEDFMDEFIELIEKGGEECSHKTYKTEGLDTYAYVNILLTDRANYNKFEIEIRDNHVEFYSCGDDVRKGINISCDVDNIEAIRKFLMGAYEDELSSLDGAADNEWNDDEEGYVIDYEDKTMSFNSRMEDFKIMEKLEFDVRLNSSYEDTVLSEVGKTGETIHAKIELLFTGTQYYVLTLSGSRGTKQFYHKETSWGFSGIPGHRLTFNTIYTVEDDTMMSLDNSETKWDFIYVDGDSSAEDELEISLGYDYYSNRSIDRIISPDTIEAISVRYEYYGDEDYLESGRNMFTLFRLPDKEEYIQKDERVLTEYDYADALNEIDIFRGTDKGYELNKSLTRDESAAMLVRLLGKESILDVDDYTQVFNDVSKDRWSFAYVMYCYEHDITKGTSADSFSPSDAVTAQQFAALLLRLMGYTDIEPEDALKKCVEVGILQESDVTVLNDSGKFDRGNMVYMVYRSLSSYMANGFILADYLSMQGAITEDEAALFDE